MSRFVRFVAPDLSPLVVNVDQVLYATPDDEDENLVSLFFAAPQGTARHLHPEYILVVGTLAEVERLLTGAPEPTAVQPPNGWHVLARMWP